MCWPNCISKLKLTVNVVQDNMNLRDQAEDLHAQLISRHVQEGRSLLQQTETSLAKEFEKLPKDEVKHDCLNYLKLVIRYI